ncbi:protein of unknown function [Candidatus Nitrosocosmicus franklandus]|uniref:Uncharacterized protein n=1 Tax=Candidatus Nitrosocosmicus franklandianus TaxID=1798806 RepID=A0A484IG21_9ARCH|nr:protein of unknown function [Candidatus Nitrosocosmicus franklandus]
MIDNHDQVINVKRHLSSFDQELIIHSFVAVIRFRFPYFNMVNYEMNRIIIKWIKCRQ